MTDHYRVLGVARNASFQDIKKGYRRLAMKWHPDKNPDQKELAEQKFKEIAGAYQVLSDPQKRREYDMFGGSSNSSGGFRSGNFSFGAGFVNPFDLFRDNFGQQDASGFDTFFFFPQSRGRPRDEVSSTKIFESRAPNGDRIIRKVVTTGTRVTETVQRVPASHRKSPSGFKNDRFDKSDKKRAKKEKHAKKQAKKEKRKKKRGR